MLFVAQPGHSLNLIAATPTVTCHARYSNGENREAAGFGDGSDLWLPSNSIEAQKAFSQERYVTGRRVNRDQLEIGLG